MKILEINGLKYSKEQFEGYKFRVTFKFNLGFNKFRNIDIYTTDADYLNVEKVLNKRKTEKVVSIDLYHWCSKEQDDIATEFLLDE